jgi:hypothetical protein
MIAVTRNLALAALTSVAAALPAQSTGKHAFDWDATRYLLVLDNPQRVAFKKIVTDAHPADSHLATHTHTSKEHMAIRITASSATS